MGFFFGVTLGNTSIGLTLPLIPGESFLVAESTLSVLKTEGVLDLLILVGSSGAMLSSWSFLVGIKSNPLIVDDREGGNASSETTL